MYLKVVRVGRPTREDKIITSATDVYNLLSSISKEDRENLFAVHLDTQCRFLATEVIAKGSLNMCGVTLREVFKTACLNNTAAIILVHNHTGGMARPSKEDILLTDRVKAFAKQINIDIHDHLVIGDGEIYSIEGRVRYIIPPKHLSIEKLFDKCLEDDRCVNALRRLNKDIYECSLCIYDKNDGYGYLYMSRDDEVRIIFDTEYAIQGVEEDYG
ncbi:JAB domain-containing protein [Candidatus Magnetominusculus dajiuhuensis]|uniref:JAB domain-containing protein n=1 Tax=Candidatus Magnetominusculus dajiuhuensis TaxID=3137712 RepID=UPI003B42F1FD